MLKQSLQQRLLQKLSPQQIQLMKMIQLPTLGFEQKLKQEIEENPALEIGKEENNDEEQDIYQDEAEDDGNETIETDFDVDDYLSDDEIPTYKLQTSNSSIDDEEKKIPYASGTTFNQFLINQLNTIPLSKKEYSITEFIIGSLDESGYLRRPIEDIIDDLAFSLNIYADYSEVEKLLKLIQQLDPSGVGARDLKECLILQLNEKKESESRKLAKRILTEAFDHFVKKHYKKLLLKFNVSEQELRMAIEEIEKLNPKPGGSFVGNTKFVEQVIPDFTIKIVEDNLELTLNSRNAPELHISREYIEMLKGYKESDKKSKSQQDAILFVKQKLDSAKWFIDAIKQRQQTLIVTMNAIMQYQREYFLTGDERKLKPMILKNIADIVKMDISTISRVANSKYVNTPYGTRLIKDYFSESMKNTAGEDISTKEIKNILQSIINKENRKKPFTDDQLAKLLQKKGYPIARRTIAKYREQLNISVARLRKQI